MKQWNTFQRTFQPWYSTKNILKNKQENSPLNFCIIWYIWSFFPEKHHNIIWLFYTMHHIAVSVYQRHIIGVKSYHWIDCLLWLVIRMDSWIMHLSMLSPYTPKYGKGGDEARIWKQSPLKSPLLGSAVICKLKIIALANIPTRGAICWKISV